jgi:electron-transferring-flavoprotein dehydrogenase
VPHLAFPGGVLVGCAAGFVNVPRIKGSHTAMKSGMLAGESIARAIAADQAGTRLDDYEEALRSSWIAGELKLVQNAQPMVATFGGVLGTVLAGADMWSRSLLGFGIAPPMAHRRDHQATGRADLYRPIAYPRPDGVISFDRLTNVAFSATNHAEDQPCHLRLKDSQVPLAVNLTLHAGPEARYCPAGVYEFVEDASGASRLQINAQNCLHCKSCDIKDPTQNIEWVTPEGAGGRNYPNM